MHATPPSVGRRAPHVPPVLPLLAALTVGSAACTESADAAPETVTMRLTCIQSTCDSINDTRSEKCSSCLTQCSGLAECDPGTVCATICAPEPCEQGLKDRCQKQGWFADVSTVATPGVEEACLGTADRFAASTCGAPPSEAEIASFSASCARQAHLLTSDAVPLLKCESMARANVGRARRSSARRSAGRSRRGARRTPTPLYVTRWTSWARP